MSDSVRIDSGRVVDFEKTTVTKLIPQNGKVTLLSKRLNIRTRPAIVALGNGVSAGAESWIRFTILVDRTPIKSYFKTVDQWGPPENPYRLPVPIEIQQGSLLEIIAERDVTEDLAGNPVSDPADDFYATVTTEIHFYDF